MYSCFLVNFTESWKYFFTEHLQTTAQEHYPTDFMTIFPARFYPDILRDKSHKQWFIIFKNETSAHFGTLRIKGLKKT